MGERLFPVYYFITYLKIKALASVAQWIECQACEPKGRQFHSQSGTHAWVVGQVPSGDHVRGNCTLMFLFLSFSLPSPLSKRINK